MDPTTKPRLPYSPSPIQGWILAATILPIANALANLVSRGLPVFMDSIFTLFATAFLGPFQGILVALLTNGWIEVLNGFSGKDMPFALCGVVSALVMWLVGRGRRRWSPARVATVIVSLALANAVVGAIIATFVFGGGTGAKIDTVAAGFALVADSIFSAAFLARLPVNLIDKALAVAVALGLNYLLRKGEAQEGSKTPAL